MFWLFDTFFLKLQGLAFPDELKLDEIEKNPPAKVVFMVLGERDAASVALQEIEAQLNDANAKHDMIQSNEQKGQARQDTSTTSNSA